MPYCGSVFWGKTAQMQRLRGLARPLLNTGNRTGVTPMTTAPFFTTRLGRAALVSIAAMLAMNAVVLAQHMPEFPGMAAHYAPAHAGVTTSVAAITGGLA
jgi:hypothetical protein